MQSGVGLPESSFPPPPCRPSPWAVNGVSLASGTEGASFSGVVAWIHDDDLNTDPSKYTAQITWGDGVVTSGTVTVRDGCSDFNVSGTHWYTEDPTMTVSVSVTDTDGSTGSATSTASVTDLALTAASPLGPGYGWLYAASGSQFSGQIATFIGLFSGENPSDMTVSIDWGDGQTSSGTAGTGGTISGTHTYGWGGIFPVRATVTDPSSPTNSVTCTANAYVVYVPIGPPEGPGLLPGDSIPNFGASAVSPENGNLQVSLPLDYRQSVPSSLDASAGLGGTPALVYNSDTVNVRPIIEADWSSSSADAVPTQIQTQLTWNNGTPQSWQTYGTTGHSAGDVYVFDSQVASAVTTSGFYPWTFEIKATEPDSTTRDVVINGSSYVLVNGSSDPFGYGWSVAGLESLVAVTGGAVLVDGSGTNRLFLSAGGNNYNSPPFDFGTLVKNVDTSYTYTTKDQVKWNFDSSGRLTSVVDPHNLTLTYSYSGSNLTQVASPDGGLTTFTYSGGLLQSITEPGGRIVTVSIDASNNVTGITDSAGGLRTLSYDSVHRLTNDRWAPLNATYTYDSNNGELSQIDRGGGATLTVIPHNVQGLYMSASGQMPPVRGA
jgi:YD repeat-containing protein